MKEQVASPESPRSNALKVASGIFISRVFGLLRERAVAHYFGVGPHADVFRTALRGPNILQNLLGEGSISAAFIPIYARLLDEGREEEAGRFAGAIFGLLAALAGLLSLTGFVLAQPIVTVFVPGFIGDAARVAAGETTVDRFRLAVSAVRIVFPMAGVLVLSAWALGVLNSHRRFFLAYVAPVLWNVSIMAALFAVSAGWFHEGWWRDVFLGSGPLRDRLLLAACTGALLGGGLQFAVQLPLVFKLMQGFRPALSLNVPGVRDAVRAFVPVVAGRGVYQFSAYRDLFLASLLAAGALAAMGYAQTLYVLPVSLFGMSVAAAELPELSRQGMVAAPEAFTKKLTQSLQQMAFLIVPTMAGYLVFGYIIVGTIYRTGVFTESDNWVAYLVLAAYSLGLLATTWSRLLQNAFYALKDTKTPARIAVVRVTLSAMCGAPLMFWLDQYSLRSVVGPVFGEAGLSGSDGQDPFLGAAGLALASAIGAWAELMALRRSLGRRLSGFGLPLAPLGRMVFLALGAAVGATVLWWAMGDLHVLWVGPAVVGLYAGVYLAAAYALEMPEVFSWVGRFRPKS